MNLYQNPDKEYLGLKRWNCIFLCLLALFAFSKGQCHEGQTLSSEKQASSGRQVTANNQSASSSEESYIEFRGKRVVIPPSEESQANTSSTQITYSRNTVNINTASAQEIAEKLKGIGPAKAKAIIQWRQRYGSFVNHEQLLNVKGIGPATLAKIKSQIIL